MIRQTAGRIVQLVIMLLVLSFLVFALLYIAPGDPAEKRLTSQGVAVTRQMLEAERERMGLLRPFMIRYGEWLGNMLRGDWGISFKDDLPVTPKLMAGLRNTVLLASLSLLLSLAVALPLGIGCALRRNSLFDRCVSFVTFIGNALPNFLLSVLLMYLLCIRFHLLPVIASGSFTGLILPVLSLSVPITSRFIRQIRAEVIRELKQPYVTGMQLRGVSGRRIVLNNVLHNCSGHILTVISLQVGTLMGGSVVIENTFRWPGIGKLVMDSITARDYPVIMGFVLIMGTIYVFLNLVTDLFGQLIDPRTVKTS